MPQIDPSNRSGWRTPRHLAAGALLILASAVPAQAASAAECAGAGEIPAAGAQERAAVATICVLNQERASRGLPALRSQGGLERAAEGHARDMVRRRYFSHTTPEGRTFDDRLRGGYIRKRARWGVGETLAWGTKSKATPTAIVRAWLKSPPHRRVVLSSRFRDIGVGVTLGVPVAGDPGATYAADLGDAAMTLFIIVGVAVWLLLTVAVMALLTAAKHGDQAMERAAADELRVMRGPAHPSRGPVRWSTPVDMLPEHEELAQVAAQVRQILGVERVSVILADDDRSGHVAACVNAPGLVGARVPVEPKRATGMLDCDEAAALGLIGETPGGASWTYAHVPLHGPDGVTGAISVAARRVLAFTSGEMKLIERLARRGAPQFERRRNIRTAA